MSLLPIELDILGAMFLRTDPMKTVQIAMEIGREVSTVMLHLTELAGKGYIISFQKNLYLLTEEGKKALGIQPITKENAKMIIAYAPHDKSFNFQVNPDNHHHIHAHSLQDFANKLSRVDLKIIESHMDQDDFEKWFKILGDPELAKKIALIKERKITGEPLRLLLHTTIEGRCQELIKLAEQATP